MCSKQQLGYRSWIGWCDNRYVIIWLYLIELIGEILEVSWNTPGTKGTTDKYLINVESDKVPLVIGTVFR